ncbi:hypothetical protein Alches_16280 [Alicyclobacillus hesperidum subsp. aegles]|uniref:hypothetical protein n=1 Tax=Alicyclobacillus hesperidum TaxID=89784 RepID=UPI002229E67A|nr:hypothetical protein [Alicyclobacillus hesperidum]GLG01588.1 hypothetical protein Alches_16280 [Alicyclobacillus hesperidum subsp. aegles]
MAVYGQMVLTQQGQSLYAKVQTGTELQFTRLQIGSGQLTTQLSSALTSGTAYTSIPVQALTSPVASGQTLTIGSGNTTQTVTASAAASVGATSISVSSFTANANYPSGTTVTLISDPTMLTGLLNPIDWVPISSISASGNTANILGIYQNKNLTQPTYTCEIGLFAQDPQAGEILYAYANAGTQGDTFPPYSAGPYSRQFQISVAVGNATQVTANVPSTGYVPLAEVGQPGGVASLDSTGNVPLSQLGNVPKVGSASSTALGIVQLPPSAGSPSNPVAVYRAVSVKDLTLTSTSATTVLSYTPAATGQFKASGYLRVANAATSVTVTLTYTSPSGAQTETLVPTYPLPTGDYTIPARTIEATTASAITLSVTAGTANNVTISAVIEGV